VSALPVLLFAERAQVPRYALEVGRNGAELLVGEAAVHGLVHLREHLFVPERDLAALVSYPYALAAHVALLGLAHYAALLFQGFQRRGHRGGGDAQALSQLLLHLEAAVLPAVFQQEEDEGVTKILDAVLIEP